MNDTRYPKQCYNMLKSLEIAWMSEREREREREREEMDVSREYVHSVVVYQKYLTGLGDKARKLSYLPTQLDIFDI